MIGYSPRSKSLLGTAFNKIKGYRGRNLSDYYYVSKWSRVIEIHEFDCLPELLLIGFVYPKSPLSVSQYFQFGIAMTETQMGVELKWTYRWWSTCFPLQCHPRQSSQTGTWGGTWRTAACRTSSGMRPASTRSSRWWTPSPLFPEALPRASGSAICEAAFRGHPLNDTPSAPSPTWYIYTGAGRESWIDISLLDSVSNGRNGNGGMRDKREEFDGVPMLLSVTKTCLACGLYVKNKVSTCDSFFCAIFFPKKSRRTYMFRQEGMRWLRRSVWCYIALPADEVFEVEYKKWLWSLLLTATCFLIRQRRPLPLRKASWGVWWKHSS